MFSSPESTVDHGVVPPAQLFSVPSTVRPSGSALVRTSGSPATGPASRKGVVAVTRRFSGSCSTAVGRPDEASRDTATTLIPWAAIPMPICSGVGAFAS